MLYGGWRTAARGTAYSSTPSHKRREGAFGLDRRLGGESFRARLNTNELEQAREREKVSVNFDENDIRFARVAVRNEKERRDNELEVGGREGGDVEKKKIRVSVLVRLVVRGLAEAREKRPGALHLVCCSFSHCSALVS